MKEAPEKELMIGHILGVKKQLIAAHARLAKTPTDCGKKSLGFQKS